MFPDKKIIDVFPREKRDDIDQWGDQKNFFTE